MPPVLAISTSPYSPPLPVVPIGVQHAAVWRIDKHTPPPWHRRAVILNGQQQARLYPRPPHVTRRGARVKVKPADGQRQCGGEISGRFPAVMSAAIAGVSVERAGIVDAANVQPRANRAGIGFESAHKAAALFDRCQGVAAQSERRRQFAAALMASLAIDVLLQEVGSKAVAQRVRGRRRK
jgi:hypothetical protein